MKALPLRSAAQLHVLITLLLRVNKGLNNGLRSLAMVVALCDRIFTYRLDFSHLKGIVHQK